MVIPVILAVDWASLINSIVTVFSGIANIALQVMGIFMP
jgi:hypothetical protein